MISHIRIRAISRLYQSRMLRVNNHFAIFFKSTVFANFHSAFPFEISAFHTQNATQQQQLFFKISNCIFGEITSTFAKPLSNIYNSVFQFENSTTVIFLACGHASQDLAPRGTHPKLTSYLTLIRIWPRGHPPHDNTSNTHPKWKQAMLQISINVAKCIITFKH